MTTPINRSSTSIRFVVTALAASFAMCSSTLAQEPFKPSKTVEIVVGSAAGGGNDKSARALQKALSDLQITESVVLNKTGAGGGLAYSYVSQKTDPHYIGIAQGGIMSNHISGRSQLDPLSDVTPLAHMGSEAVAISVRADSPLKSIGDLAAQLEKDPSSLSISVGSDRGGVNNSAVALIAKSRGIAPKDLKIIVTNGASESVTNLLGGHIDVMSQLQNSAIPHQHSGAMRILCVTSANRADIIPDVPTCKEEGFDVVLANWTVVIGPKTMTEDQVKGWEAILKQVNESETWKALMEAVAGDGLYMDSATTREYLEADYASTKDLMVELGLAKKQ